MERELALRNGGGRPSMRASHVSVLLTRMEAAPRKNADSPKRLVPDRISSIVLSREISFSRELGPPSLHLTLLQQRTK